MDVVLAPDIYVNASVALGSPPDKGSNQHSAGQADDEKGEGQFEGQAHNTL